MGQNPKNKKVKKVIYGVNGLIDIEKIKKDRVNKILVFVVLVIVVILSSIVAAIIIVNANKNKEEATKPELPKEEIVEEEVKEEKLPVYSEEAKLRMKDIYKAAGEEKNAYLTFDDGPSKNITPQILEILRKEEIKATFFVLGSRVELYPELVKQEYEEGHYIANHRIFAYLFFNLCIF